MRRLSFSRPEGAGASSTYPVRVRPDQMQSLAGQARDVGADHTAVDELIRMVNVTRVWTHWNKPVVIVVSRDAPQHYTCLREAFRAVPWLKVVMDRRDVQNLRSPIDRRHPDRRQRVETADRLRPWEIVRGDAIEVDGPPWIAGRPSHSTLRAVPRLLRWTWNTGRRIGRYAADRTLALPRG